ncbi:MAG: hypothetical protein LC802_21760 [Acidobacteria bacterium]|nr:hypothetical protein [Acidobacteriota bacterium]
MTCALLSLLLIAPASRAQNAGSPHDADIFGVRVGMDVPTTLEAVFVNAKRQPKQEKPDAKKAEGKDVRILYKLKEGTLQIVFADGKRVSEVQFEYARPLLQDDLKLLDSSGNFGNTEGGTGRDDRYSVGFTGDEKKERYWWRDEKTDAGYRVRVGFISGKLNKGGMAGKEIARKIITVVPEDKGKFAKASASS